MCAIPSGRKSCNEIEKRREFFALDCGIFQIYDENKLWTDMIMVWWLIFNWVEFILTCSTICVCARMRSAIYTQLNMWILCVARVISMPFNIYYMPPTCMPFQFLCVFWLWPLLLLLLLLGFFYFMFCVHDMAVAVDIIGYGLINFDFVNSKWQMKHSKFNWTSSHPFLISTD